MLRPISSDSLNHLLAASKGADFDLDLALLRIGVYAPADLSEIRSILTQAGTRLTAGTNADGHRLVTVLRDDRLVAQIGHDGAIERVTAPSTA